MRWFVKRKSTLRLGLDTTGVTGKTNVQYNLFTLTASNQQKIFFCLKEQEHMTVHCVFCALCMVYPGMAVSWNRQDCNRQSMQRVQMLGHNSNFPKSHFLDSGRKK